MRYERRIVVISVAALAPVAVAAIVLTLAGDFSAKARWTVLFVIAVATFIATYFLHEQLVYPLRTVANIITALREEDYSLRGRNARGDDDALGELMTEVNALAELMESRKLEAIEAAALLRAVMTQIDAAIFAFDEDDRLQLVNRAGERLLAANRERLFGRTAAELELADLLDGDAPQIDRTFAGGAGRWDVRRSSFRERGAPHRMLVLADITRALREEESEAWRRIVRVLGHELNNSLAPIRSIATSMERLLMQDALPHDWREDVTSGMRVIGSRTEALTRFTKAYAQLARLPEPKKRNVAIAPLVRRVTALEARKRIVLEGPETTVHADEDQLEQLLINLVKNAADAASEVVRVRWSTNGDGFMLRVEDDGPGVSGTANLFIPFFTTKPGGSGIGLFLSRQIAEAHGGTLDLANGGVGAVATLTLQPTMNDER